MKISRAERRARKEGKLIAIKREIKDMIVKEIIDKSTDEQIAMAIELYLRIAMKQNPQEMHFYRIAVAEIQLNFNAFLEKMRGGEYTVAEGASEERIKRAQGDT